MWHTAQESAEPVELKDSHAPTTHAAVCLDLWERIANGWPLVLRRRLDQSIACLAPITALPAEQTGSSGDKAKAPA